MKPFPKRNLVWVAFLIVLLAILIFSKNYFASNNESSTKEFNESTENIDSNIPADWKQYSNTNLGFSLQLPTSFGEIRDLTDEYNCLILFKESNNNFFEVRLFPDRDLDIGIKYGYLGAEIINNNINLGGVRGFEAISSTGYGDAGEQGSPYVTLFARHNGAIYNLTFYGDAELSPQEQQIFSSFEFQTKDPQSTCPYFKQQNS